jgi:translocation and assembly module TamB
MHATDLTWLGAATQGELLTGGQLRIDVAIGGTLGTPELSGLLHGENLQLAWLDQGMRLEQGHLEARFDKDNLLIDTLSFSAPHDVQPRDPLLSGWVVAGTPGTLTATGKISLNGSGSEVALSAYRLPLTQRQDRWIIISGNGQARLEKSTLSLNGSISADAGLISQPASNRPQLAEDVVFTGQQAETPKGLNLALEGNIDLGEHFFLRASGLEARLTGRLQVREVPGQTPRMTGSIATRDGSFEAYGQHLTVERGIVNFAGPIYDPGLNLLALRKGLSVEAGVAVTGTALHPIVRLISIPEVPDTEKLSWIVLGRPPDASGMDISLLLAAAEGMVGGGSSGITGQIKQTMGVDQLSLRANDNNALSSQAISEDPLSNQIAVVGKRLSARAFLSYEQRVTAATGVTKLTYMLTPRINIVTQAGFDNAIDIQYTFSFE